MTIYSIRGGGSVDLNTKNFIASGGEGDVYIHNNIAYKIFNSTGKMMEDGKFNELSKIDHDNVIKPLKIILDRNNKPCGFSMKNVPDAVPIVQLFTNTFRDRNNITADSTIKLVENIREGISAVHKAGCLVVDVNEMNFMVDAKKNNFTDVYFIDTNSYQTPNYPATAIMPSVRDYCTNTFNELTDWYSFAIISFQLFTGIHPYKGKHPSYGKKDLVKRMTDGISILDPKTSTPRTMRDLSCIPVEYMKWYEDIFLRNKRVPPPNSASAVNMQNVLSSISQSTDNFNIDVHSKCTQNIISFLSLNNKPILIGTDTISINRNIYSFDSKKDNILLSPMMNKPIKTGIINNKLYVSDVASNKNLLFSEVNAQEVLVVDSNIYYTYNGKLTMLKCIETATSIMFTPLMSWDIMTMASKVYTGCVYQNILSKCWFTIPNPTENKVHNIAIPELDDYKVITAKYIKNVLVVIAYKEGIYSQCIIRFNFTYSYDIRQVDDIDYRDINMVVLDNTMCLLMLDDGILELFRSTKGDTFSKYINDANIGRDMILCNTYNSVHFIKDKTLYNIKMK